MPTPITAADPSTPTASAEPDPSVAPRPAWEQAMAGFRHPVRAKAIRQLVETLVPLAALWALMAVLGTRGHSWWLIAGLSLLASPLLVRVFIIFHDCCHGSFFASRRANRIVGYITGILTMTPYEQWRRAHSLHHATVGDLDRRGDGDIWTLTVDEYLASSRARRFAYRAIRNPLVMLGVGPAYVFSFAQRIFHPGDGPRERRSVVITDIAIAALVALACFTVGARTFVLIQVPMSLVAGAVGVWLFYVQHQYEGVYWARHDAWDPMVASLDGSSYYRLPKLLQWFTGSIGLHHIHHVQPRIPNYNLQACYDAVPRLQQVKAMSLLASMKSLRLNLWDERRQRLIGFGDLAACRAERGPRS